MADLKISALPPASTPLAGTEVLPIVQSGTTRKVSVSDLTAGRAVSAGDLSYTGTLTGSTGILNIGSGQLYKDATGRVGVATASPSTNLSVGDDSTSVSRQISLHGPASGANNGASINVRNGTDTVFAVGNASNIIGGAYSSDAMLFWGNAALRFYGNGAERARIDSSGNLTVNTGNLVLGTAGKGITTSVTNGNINLIPTGSGIVASDSGHSFNKIASRRVSKAVAKSGTAVLTVTPVSTTSTHLAVRIDINVAFTNSTNLQYHAGYLVLTCDQTTNGGGTAIAEYYNGTVGNFVVATTDFVVTRPGSGQLVVTYTNNNGADSNNIEFAVTGVFDAATIA